MANDLWIDERLCKECRERKLVQKVALLLFYVFDFRIDDRIELSVHENICLNNPTLLSHILPFDFSVELFSIRNITIVAS